MPSGHFNSIPSLDMRQYRSTDTTIRRSFITALRETCHDVGFFYLDHHGVSPTVMHEILALSKLFFEQPQHIKDSINIARSPHYRGYGRLNAETTRGIPDYKETYDLGLESHARETNAEPYLILHGPNQWADSAQLAAANFKSKILAYMQQMMQLGFELMQAIAESLDANTTAFNEEFDPSNDDAFAMLRLLHYPPATNNELGVGPHVDAGWLVFLLQDEVGGLEVMNREKTWICAPPVTDKFIVNIGETLQHWSSNYFKATPHRVINKGNKFRISAPFFFEPNLTTIVRPIDLAEKLIIGSENKSEKNAREIIYGEQMLKIFQRSFIRK